MAAFAYRAVDRLGHPSKGVIEASSLGAARRTLRERELLPVAVAATNAPVVAGATPRFGAGRRATLGAKALATATRQLATLAGTDVRIEEALRLVGEQAGVGAAGPLLLNVRGSILDGNSFAAALAEHPAAFPEFYRASVRAGEQSGKLGEVLGHLADFVENRYRTANTLQLALLYPALLAVVSGSMMVLLLIYVVPDIVHVFVSRGAALPFLTRALIGLSGFAQHYGLVVLVLTAGAVFVARRWLKLPTNRLAFDRWLNTTPPFARFSRQLNASRFAGSLATLVSSDVPLTEALATAAAVTPNAYVRAAALNVAARVREGTSLNRALAEAAVFPPMLVAIVASGETSGRLGTVLLRAARDMERDLEALTTALMALVEPAVLLLMGGIVLMMVLSILLPIIDLNSLAGL